jgi:1-acyl-sn-glycerol-3-phosphate acyltransferase
LRAVGRHDARCWRLLRMLGRLLAWFLCVSRACQTDQQSGGVQAWAQQHAGGLRHRSSPFAGTPPVKGPVMLVANHISWLDIPVMHAARHCRFVSKSDVQAIGP